MGGHIEARSTAEGGTIFNVEFPVSGTVEDNYLPLQHDLLTSPASTGKTSILVIDDDPIALVLTERFLNRGDYETFLVDNGNEAIKLAIELKPDVILLDLMMPAIDGWTVLSILKENPTTENIPVILLSMLDEKNLGYDMGAIEYLRKPVDWDKLIKIIGDIRPCKANKQLLLLDKKSSFRDVLANSLNRLGWQVKTVDSERGLQKALEKSSPRIIIAAEHKLTTGQADPEQWFANLQKTDSRHIPVIVLTAKPPAAEQSGSDNFFRVQATTAEIENIITTLSASHGL
jgi:hypothetical protein